MSEPKRHIVSCAAPDCGAKIVGPVVDARHGYAQKQAMDLSTTAVQMYDFIITRNGAFCSAHSEDK